MNIIQFNSVTDIVIRDGVTKYINENNNDMLSN